MTMDHFWIYIPALVYCITLCTTAETDEMKSIGLGAQTVLIVSIVPSVACVIFLALLAVLCVNCHKRRTHKFNDDTADDALEEKTTTDKVTVLNEYSEPKNDVTIVSIKNECSEDGNGPAKPDTNHADKSVAGIEMIRTEATDTAIGSASNEKDGTNDKGDVPVISKVAVSDGVSVKEEVASQPVKSDTSEPKNDSAPQQEDINVSVTSQAPSDEKLENGTSTKQTEQFSLITPTEESNSNDTKSENNTSENKANNPIETGDNKPDVAAETNGKNDLEQPNKLVPGLLDDYDYVDDVVGEQEKTSGLSKPHKEDNGEAVDEEESYYQGYDNQEDTEKKSETTDTPQIITQRMSVPVNNTQADPMRRPSRDLPKPPILQSLMTQQRHQAGQSLKEEDIYEELEGEEKNISHASQNIPKQESDTKHNSDLPQQGDPAFEGIYESDYDYISDDKQKTTNSENTTVQHQPSEDSEDLGIFESDYDTVEVANKPTSSNLPGDIPEDDGDYASFDDVEGSNSQPKVNNTTPDKTDAAISSETSPHVKAEGDQTESQDSSGEGKAELYAIPDMSKKKQKSIKKSDPIFQTDTDPPAVPDKSKLNGSPATDKAKEDVSSLCVKPITGEILSAESVSSDEKDAVRPIETERGNVIDNHGLTCSSGDADHEKLPEETQEKSSVPSPSKDADNKKTFDKTHDNDVVPDKTQESVNVNLQADNDLSENGPQKIEISHLESKTPAPLLDKENTFVAIL